MDPERARIQADLRGLIEGEVHCNDLFLQMYATDASILQLRPIGVVRPRSTADVVACAEYASENHLSLHARGSGSNVVGGAIGRGLILDFSYFMRRFTPLSGNRVCVQPGVVLSHLNRQLARRGQMFAPDPATRSVTTMGGVIAMNGMGSHWMKYGATRDLTLSLTVVLASGKVIEVGPESKLGRGGDPALGVSMTASVMDLVTRKTDLISTHQPNTRINHAGYELADLMIEGQLDLSRLICGSEGTLGLITEAVLQTQPIPQHRGVILFFFDRMDKAVRCGLEVIRGDVSACDLMDRRLLSIACEADARFARLIPQQAEAMLLVEVQAASDAELRQQVQDLNDRMTRRRSLAFESRMTCETEQRNLFWRMVRRIVPMQLGLKGNRQPIPFVEDIAIAPDLLPQFLTEMYSIVNSHDVTASVFSNLGQGSVQIRPQLDLADDDDVAKIPILAEELFALTWRLGGSISGSHGDGLVRTKYLRRQYAQMCSVFGEVKRIFDPQNLLNPGVIVDSPRIEPTDHLRLVKAAVPEQELAAAGEDNAAGGASNGTSNGTTKLPVFEPQLMWSVPEIAAAAGACNGCARCRTSSPDERMCPIFRLAPREEASPRSKANLARALITGELNHLTLNDDELKGIADLCVNCHQCRLECPAGVDIPKLMVETKAQYVAVNGLKMSQWLLIRLDLLYSLASRSPWMANWMIRNRMMRWILDKLLGIAQSRKLPTFSNQSFLRWAQRRRLTQLTHRQDSKVLYFVDAFANWNDVELAKATVSLLKHNGFDVFVPPTQLISGMSLISAGVVDRAKRIAARNVEILAEGVRQGCHIVTTEPSAALALTHEYLNLLDDDDSRMVAANTTDISSFLWNLHQSGRLELDFNPLNYTVGYHLPCHQRALSREVPALQLMGLIPGLQVERIERGCSGMAGTYGLIRANYRRSLRAGVGLISAMRSPKIMVGATECSTCKIQMEQGTVKPTLHPAKILAFAYGLLPELNDLFERRSGELTIS